MSKLKELLEEFYPDDSFIILDGLDECVKGVTVVGSKRYLVYSIANIASLLRRRDGMTYEEAMEFIDFNITSAYFGEANPIFLEDDIVKCMRSIVLDELAEESERLGLYE